MDTINDKRIEFAHKKRFRKICLIVFVVFSSIVFSIPSFSQFTDLPEDKKTVDLGVSGNGILQTFSLTTVLPISNINGWAGFFGSRAAGEEGVISEIIKLHIEGGIPINKVEFEIFSYLERNITDGTALTAQVGGSIELEKYKKGSLIISANFGYFLETIQPLENLSVRQFDPTSFRWLISSTVDWQKLNTELTFTPEIGFKNYRFCAEPTFTFDITTRLGLRLSGTFTYNSAPLTENLKYNYQSILRITL
ncbi:hypothetical protein J4G08_16590 [Candidatus Poribacteria bacterium]|nr:hypothetical protein [Candidatus Poribacteria bacterium]